MYAGRSRRWVIVCPFVIDSHVLTVHDVSVTTAGALQKGSVTTAAVVALSTTHVWTAKGMAPGPTKQITVQQSTRQRHSRTAPNVLDIPPRTTRMAGVPSRASVTTAGTMGQPTTLAMPTATMAHGPMAVLPAVE